LPNRLIFSDGWFLQSEFRRLSGRAVSSDYFYPLHLRNANRMATLDKNFGIIWFHEQKQGIIEKYVLKALTKYPLSFQHEI
jgi:hypothetical protein